jgi:hypothetical protein
LIGEPEGKRALERLRLRWVVNIKMDLGEVGWGVVDWIGVAQDRGKLESSCECGINKMLGNCQAASQLVASRVVFSCIQLVG